jgi:hypothetical protein
LHPADHAECRSFGGTVTIIPESTPPVNYHVPVSGTMQGIVIPGTSVHFRYLSRNFLGASLDMDNQTMYYPSTALHNSDQGGFES